MIPNWDEHPLILSLALKNFPEDAARFVKHLQTLRNYDPRMLWISEHDSEHGRKLIDTYGGRWYGFRRPSVRFAQGRCTNIAIREAPEDALIINVFADFRLPLDWIDQVYAVWRENRYDDEVLMGPPYRYECPDHGKLDDVSSMVWTEMSGQPRFTWFQALGRGLGHALRGFDEEITDWGGVDSDFEERAHNFYAKLFSGDRNAKYVADNRLTYIHLSHDDRPIWKWKGSQIPGRARFEESAERKLVTRNIGIHWGKWDEFQESV